MSTTTTEPTAAAPITSKLSLWARIQTEAALLWHWLTLAEQDAATVEKDHPEIIATANAIIAAAPPQVREDVAVAEALANAVQGMERQAQAAGVTTAVPVPPSAAAPVA